MIGYQKIGDNNEIDLSNNISVFRGNHFANC